MQIGAGHREPCGTILGALLPMLKHQHSSHHTNTEFLPIMERRKQKQSIKCSNVLDVSHFVKNSVSMLNLNLSLWVEHRVLTRLA